MRCPQCKEELAVCESSIYAHAIDGVYVVLNRGKCGQCASHYDWVNEDPQSVREIKTVI